MAAGASTKKHKCLKVKKEIITCRGEEEREQVSTAETSVAGHSDAVWGELRDAWLCMKRKAKSEGKRDARAFRAYYQKHRQL